MSKVLITFLLISNIGLSRVATCHKSLANKSAFSHADASLVLKTRLTNKMATVKMLSLKRHIAVDTAIFYTIFQYLNAKLYEAEIGGFIAWYKNT